MYDDQMRPDSDYGLDPQGRLRFYGLYSAKVISVSDPLKKNRIQVQVYQTTSTAVTGWAKACLPVADNSYHPDHVAHTAAQVAALLTNHSLSVTSGAASGGTSHTHSVTATLTHVGNSGTLKHPHAATKTMVNNNVKVNTPTSKTDTQEVSKYSDSTVPEHTFHRTIPAVGQLVWVMFEAGDPEYPVWMGVQS
jgi:hypothetical protein